MNKDTIAAISSGLSDSGISIIRISGPAAFSIADRIFKSVSGKSIDDISNFSVSYGHIVDDSEVVDEVLLIKMQAPKTYTCEDVVEIDCHGGIVVTRKVLETVLRHGARIAEPGEFTKRAFLNGRIDLSQAEAVIDIINSKNELSLKNSLKQLKGHVRDRIADIREIILSKTAYIEAALDDPEHISLDGFGEELLTDLRSLYNDINKLSDSYNNGRLMKEGIRTVIIGKPNAGKSSLLNALMGEDRAIVTDIAGTTRDTLEETINLKGLTLNIIDTAGIREADNVIEQIGVDKALKAASDADLILYVIDASDKDDYKEAKISEIIRDKKTIILYNKIDLIDKAVLDSLSDKQVCISAKTGEGIEELSNMINKMFFDGQLKASDDVCITNLRHKQLIDSAALSISKVIESIEMGMPEDFFSIDLMDAYTSLGLITGDNVEDDLADKIFSDFCMGK